MDTMDIFLDASSPEPLYRQLRAALERRIVAGHFEDRSLPSSRALATELGLGRNTVNAAYQELIAEGLVTSRQRSGLVVNKEMQALLIKPRRPDSARTVTRPDWQRELVPIRDSGLLHIHKPRDWSRYRYPFVFGQVVAEAFPTDAWNRCLRDAVGPRHKLASLQDSGGDDDPLLVEMLRKHVLPSRGIAAGHDEILVTLGSQQALYLLAEALVSPDARVAVEDPGYPDTAHIFSRAGARLLPAAVDHGGVVLTDAVEHARVVTLTPSHQFPTGVTLSAARRRALLRAAEENAVFVVEDDHDSEFRYEGRPTPALKALDRADRVIYVGSFSKFLAPGLRLGFLVGAADLVADLRDRRRYMVRHPPGQLQRALALLIASGEYMRTLRRMRTILKRRWLALTTALQQNLAWDVAIPTGGVSVWVEGPPELDTRRLQTVAADRGVLIEPGDTFFVATPRPHRHFKLGFGAIAEARIEPGIRLLAEAIDECLA